MNEPYAKPQIPDIHVELPCWSIPSFCLSSVLTGQTLFAGIETTGVIVIFIHSDSGTSATPPLSPQTMLKSFTTFSIEFYGLAVFSVNSNSVTNNALFAL